MARDFIIDGTSALAAQEPAETALLNQVSQIEKDAEAAVITNDQEYSDVGEVLKEVKSRQKYVTDFFEPMRAKTYGAYQEVIKKKKDTLKPLETAERILKGKMSRYRLEQERERKEQEAAMRRLAQQEMEKKLAEAANADSAGDLDGAEAALAEAEIMDTVAATGIVSPIHAKVKGISESVGWRIVSVDAGKVPVSFNGMELRPVDEKAVMRLIKAAKGQIQIPGIQYVEEVQISARG